MENIQDMSFGKTSQAHSQATEAKTSKRCLTRSSASSKRQPKCLFLKKGNGHTPIATWETDGALLTEFSTLNIGESPNDVVESTLSQILEVGVPAMYYLSPKACQGILRRASVRGKELPIILKNALERQALGSMDTTEARRKGSNARCELRNVHRQERSCS